MTEESAVVEKGSEGRGPRGALAAAGRQMGALRRAAGKDSPPPRRRVAWNRLASEEQAEVVRIALDRTLKERVCLIVYMSPGQLRGAIREARRKKKAATLEARKLYNRAVRERLNRPSQPPQLLKVKSA